MGANVGQATVSLDSTRRRQGQASPLRAEVRCRTARLQHVLLGQPWKLVQRVSACVRACVHVCVCVLGCCSVRQRGMPCGTGPGRCLQPVMWVGVLVLVEPCAWRLLHGATMV